MSATWEAPDEWLVVFDVRGGMARVGAHEESKLDAAVTSYLESGKDALVRIDFVEGEEYTTLASDVVAWFRSTPEMRERGNLLDEKVKAESKASGGWRDDE